MLRPRLGQCLQLAIGWVTSKLPEISLDRSHLVEIECEHTGATDRFELPIVRLAQLDLIDARSAWIGQIEQVMVERRRGRQIIRPKHLDGLDQIVGQEYLSKRLDLGGRYL